VSDNDDDDGYILPNYLPTACDDDDDDGSLSSVATQARWASVLHDVSHRILHPRSF